MKKIPFFRRQYIVDKGVFQFRFLLPFLLSWLTAAATSTIFFNLMVQREIEKLLWKAHVTIDTTDQIIGQLFIYTIGLTSLVLLVLLALSCWFIRAISNGVAIRMVKDLNAVAAGDFSKHIRLRKKDEFQEVAAALNDFIEERRLIYQALSTNVRQLHDRINRIKLAEAKKQLTGDDLEQLRESVRQLRSELAVAVTDSTTSAGNP